jgi:uncharacterized protein YndB with AHSA1/START domain
MGDGAGSKTFAGHCPADPSEAWAALTDAARTPDYLYGLALHSTWAPDASIEGRYGNAVTITGRVLCARPGERLSYVLAAGADAPPVYLTWLLRPHPDGCTIRLLVDEIESADTADDAEDTWLPVLAGLQQALARP